jgi:protocatechuate 3,4-dioxygenase, beta subunit
MNQLYKISILFVLFNYLTSCNGQTNNKSENINNLERVGGDCEAGYCELMYLGMPEEINSVDTSAGWYEKGQKLILTGTAYQIDNKTPAANVIIYYHHTDNDGYYSPRNDKPENQTRHGHIRGWMRTGKDGKYTLYTIRPAPYPDSNEPAHIHWLIKEPEVKNEYWTDDLLFEDDTLLLSHLKNHRLGNRGGNGIVKVVLKDNIQRAEKNFILGLNIPNYPKK